VKKIIFALTALLALSFLVGCVNAPSSGQSVYREMPGYAPQAFMSTNSCQKACMMQGFEQGTCKWPGEVADAQANLGPCVIDYSSHCGSPGMCNCYCYRTPGNVPTKGYWP